MSEGKHNLHLRFADEFNKLAEDFLRWKAPKNPCVLLHPSVGLDYGPADDHSASGPLSLCHTSVHLHFQAS